MSGENELQLAMLNERSKGLERRLLYFVMKNPHLSDEVFEVYTKWDHTKQPEYLEQCCRYLGQS